MDRIWLKGPLGVLELPEKSAVDWNSFGPFWAIFDDFTFQFKRRFSESSQKGISTDPSERL